MGLIAALVTDFPPLRGATKKRSSHRHAKRSFALSGGTALGEFYLPAPTGSNESGTYSAAFFGFFLPALPGSAAF